ncbi:hypothetical protein HU200_037144 [Digitaria exilis]|uniref:FLZ-type domain-containing protein n=1 Tax=Digitaria exilis TaxID=1010633 RepID=A0A835EHQ4_9POAL|nr:hypothetical protein HU200_037144 [Digitaria exilis]CAB3478133.1 unnamed protein product [Digitaria exilis]
MVESNGQGGTAPAAAGFFRVPGLFVRLSSNSKGAAASNAVDPDSVWSPTSPLDVKSLRSSPPRVGLGLVDALTADGSCSVHLGCRSSFLDSIRPFLELALPKACVKAASSAGVATTAAADEVGEYAESEEYTCVISRGPNPRTTHILAGETREVRGKGEASGDGCSKAIFSIEPFSDLLPSSRAASPTTSSASGRCRCCMKRLPEKMDIFMYLGKAFCSNECRKGYIEEEIEEAEELMILDSALNP